VWLARGVLPGELVQVEEVAAKPELVRGRLRAVMEASPQRVAPRCPYVPDCGGCDYQHIAEAHQLEQKVVILREVLARVGKVAAPEEIRVVAGPAWGYRNRIQLHFDEGRMGFHAHGSNRLVRAESCVAASTKLNEAMQAFQRMTRDRRWPRFVKTIELFTNESEVQVNVLDSGPRRVGRGFFEWCGESLAGVLAPALEYPAAGAMFRVSHRSFFQVNRFLIDALAEAVLGDEAGGEALDLYAGAGLFSLGLARRFERVTAVESASSAVADLQFNAGRAGVRVDAVRSGAAEYLLVRESAPELVIADPPRAGLGKEVVRELVRLRPRRLVVVSCDPATLARDLRGLTDAGFAVESMTMVDLFPQTAHIETVTRCRFGPLEQIKSALS